MKNQIVTTFLLLLLNAGFAFASGQPAQPQVFVLNIKDLAANRSAVKAKKASIMPAYQQ